ncbi:DUF3429 domain-containing protein [Rhodobaculum claviforme]|uniref:DUF3429 domain-containing protein n=1 Tax=Rhodobaculum claviforme TaxID=1549854 RepID=A0A934TKV7_9RHOB|nr:DUF3429 domain-containing protein [Rhodobaculum claviforme]MBK5926898.1 DUF3429 domain-containing protein [Rhodobaculum claviforme]
MTPRPALALGFAGLVPFVWGALTVLVPALAEAGATLFGPRLVGVPVLVGYGTIILCFMGGVLWGFATRAEPAMQWKAYGTSVLPALWVFFTVGGTLASSLSALFVGFFAMLSLDLQFGQWRLTPPWWIGFRIVLTLVVMVCLGIGFAFGR